MDIANLQLSESVVIELVHPATHTPIGVQIELASSESARMRAFVRESVNKRLKMLGSGKRPNLTLEEREDDVLDILVEATIGWSNIELDGKLYEFSKENVRALYTDPRFVWIKLQVDAAYSDLSTFFRK